MSQHTTNPNFRYSNDNRSLSDSIFTQYASQQTVDPLAQKGERNYYANDNGGFYANSNRLNLSVIDPIESPQYPNQNLIGGFILSSPALVGESILDVGNADVSSLSIGDVLVIDEGTNIEEEVVIAGFSSIVLEQPLKFNHSAGARIRKLSDAQIIDAILTEANQILTTEAGNPIGLNLITTVPHEWASQQQTLDVQENQTSVNYDVDLEENDATSIEFILGGVDANQFNIDSATGAISFKSAPDYEVSALTYNINVIARDSVLTIPDAIKQLTINITNVIDTPHYWETTSEDVYVEDNIQDDPLLLVAYTNDLVAGEAEIVYEIDNSSFTINQSGQLSFVNTPDYDTQNSYTVSITAKDQNNNFADQVKTINVIVYSLAMEWIVPEGSQNISGSGNSIIEQLEYTEEQTIAVDHLTQIKTRSAESISYSLGTTGGDEDSFLIDSQSGELTFKNPPVYSELDAYSISINVIATYSIPAEPASQTGASKDISIQIKELLHVSTQNTEEEILSSTPTNPTGEVAINFATDTNNLYIYDGEDWYIYDDIFITDATSTEAEILASSPTNPTDLVTVKYATDTNNLYVYNQGGWFIFNND